MSRLSESLVIKPISLKDANAYVIENHRHHWRARGHKFSLAVYKGDVLHGVAIVGHPQGRYDDDGETLEVLRLCTDGTFNACSILYGRCARAARDLGYRRIITFILEDESGTSLKASGWKCVDEHCGGADWSKNQRYRDRHEYEQLSFIPKREPPKVFKKRWEKEL